MIHQNSPNNVLSSSYYNHRALSLTNETWQHNFVQFISWQRRESVCVRERECVSFWSILLAVFPVERVWEGVQRQPEPPESQALFKWCYHNTFVSTPSVSLAHSLTSIILHPLSLFSSLRMPQFMWLLCTPLMPLCFCSCGRNKRTPIINTQHTRAHTHTPTSSLAPSWPFSHII